MEPGSLLDVVRGILSALTAVLILCRLTRPAR
jgi:hypothetical protein